jgi:phosphoribosyl-ATP pyrophosphohydrolase
MIIPQIAADDAHNVSALIEKLKHWSLFGSVALCGTVRWSRSDLEQVASAIGGSVDLQIEYDGRSEEETLGLLNAGAIAVYARRDVAKPFDSIPDDCWRNLVHENVASTRSQQTVLDDPNPAGVAEMDRLGIDVLVDTEMLERDSHWIADFFNAALKSDRSDQLWPTVIVDELGLALGLAYSNYESLLDAVMHRRGTYWSRSRGEVWAKGAASGNVQRLIGVRMDCDRDTLRFQVQQGGTGFCHLGTYSCFGRERMIAAVIDRLRERCGSDDQHSFTNKLIRQPEMLRAKLLEEAEELAEAQSQKDVAFEAADVLYFTLVKMLSAEVGLKEVFNELSRRMTRITRRKNKLESNDR